jgi:hypothetical protein
MSEESKIESVIHVDEDADLKLKTRFIPTDEEARIAIQTILNIPDLLDKLVAARDKEKKRRSNWSKLANAPYYRKRYALELKAVVDDMLQKGCDKEYRYDDYVDLSHKTIYLRLNQAKLFLLDELDPDLFYKENFQRISITQEKTGVRLSLMKEITSMAPVDVGLDEKKSEWQDKITKYLETAKIGDAPLRIDKLSLTAEEVEIQKESFINIPGVSAFITATEILIVKFEEGSK